MNHLEKSSDYFNESGSPESFDIKSLLLKFLKYWPIFLLSMITALGLAHFKNKFTHPQYKVEGKFFIKEDLSTLSLLDLTGKGGNLKNSTGNSLSNEMVILKSKPIAKMVLDRMNLDIEYYKKGNFIFTEAYKDSPILAVVDWEHPQIVNGKIKISWNSDEDFLLEFQEDEYSLVSPNSTKKERVSNTMTQILKIKYGEWIELPITRFKIEKISEESFEEIFIKFKDLNTLLNEYTGDNFQIWPLDVTGSSILGLSLITNHPEKGSDYINTLMEAYLEDELKQKSYLAKSTIDFIDAQISGVSDSLSFIETSLQNFRSSNKTYDIETEGISAFKGISDLEKELGQEKFKRDYYKNLENYLLNEEYNEIIMPSGIGIEDPILNKLIQDLIRFQTEKSRLLATQTEASLYVLDISKKIREITISVREVLKNLNNNINFSIKEQETRLKKLEAEFSKLPVTEQNLLRIQRKFTLNENIYNFLLQRRAESAISLSNSSTGNKIIEYAIPEFLPLGMKSLTNLVLALAAGFLLPLCVIVLINMLNLKISDLEEAEEVLQVPTLSRIGQNRSNSDIVVLNQINSATSEAFRSLRTNIYLLIPREQKITIAVTSSISGEGKSFCALNLASSYSLNGKKTLLIDCDLHKPKPYKEFKLTHNNGLSTYLSSQEKSAANLIQSTPYENLDVLKAGPIPPNPGELILKSQFRDLLDEFKLKYDVIILDTPPVGLVSETLELIRYVDICLYMFRYKFSTFSMLKDLNNLKNKKGIQNLYAIFNDVENKNLNYGGYGYGYYTEDHKNSFFLKKIIRSIRGRAAM
ncbi:GumC family protein [Lunatibacter salilacus]|uniref:GumC family protein n=1 Tax=Lunatibacter salilacus TaxID=2483804 RepID=UPI00131E8F21|nr:tyrosine-protein kinase family protein [Lunatibacter salilacus]